MPQKKMRRTGLFARISPYLNSMIAAGTHLDKQGIRTISALNYMYNYMQLSVSFSYG